MNKKQFEVWKKQKKQEYEIALNKLRNDFASRGLTFSGMRDEAENDLKTKYDSDIEIERLGVEEDTNKGRVAVKMTESARNNVFINSQINGRLELGGQGNSFIETRVDTLKREHPFWFWFTAAGTFVGIITGIIFLAQYFDFLPVSWNKDAPLISENKDFATSTIPLSEILSKALALDTVVERQDFLKKYIGSTVSAEGAVQEVSRSGNGFLVDIVVNRKIVTCPQDGNDENEKIIPLLKGKYVQFIGTFPFTEIYGHGLGIDECILKRLQ